MGDRRIRVPKGCGDLVRDLMQTGDAGGPFRYQVDVLAFSASLGVRLGYWKKVEEGEGEPIRLEVFERQGYVPLMNVLAVVRTGDVRVLADTDEMEERRAGIFEGYARGGLGFLREELRGTSDYLERVVLLLAREGDDGRPAREFHLEDLLGG